MAIEVQSSQFAAICTYVDDLTRFYKFTNELTKLNGGDKLRHELAIVVTKTQEFGNLIKTQEVSAKQLSGFNKFLKTLTKSFADINRGLDTLQINSAKTYRAAFRTAVFPAVKGVIDHAKKFAPSGVSEEQLEKDVEFQKRMGASESTLKIIRNAAKIIKEGDASQVKTEADRAKKADQDAADKLSQYRAASSKLPTTLGGKLFSLVKLPVVPYVDFTLLDPKFLRTTGLSFSFIAQSFVVFEEQYLLAFDYIAATTDTESGKKRKDTNLKKTGSTLAARKRAGVHKTLQEEFILSVLDGINSKSEEEYTLMSSHFEFAPNNGKIAFAWIVPKRIQKIFARKGDLENATWGFPWNKKATSIL